MIIIHEKEDGITIMGMNWCFVGKEDCGVFETVFLNLETLLLSKYEND